MPIRVMVPPMMAAKLSGMRKREGERPVRRVHDRTPGIVMATIGVLFRKAEAAAVGTSSRARAPRSPGSRRRARPGRVTRATSDSSTRVRAAAAART